MRHARLLLPVVLAAVCAAGCGGARNGITIPLKPKHGSGVDGFARLVPTSAGSRLTIELDGDPPLGLTAAVYRGSCRLLPTRPVSQQVAPAGENTFSLRTPAPPRELAGRSVALKRAGTVLACGDLPAGVSSG